MEANASSLIIVEQIPVIAQNLAAVKAEVEERTSRAAGLICTEETVKDVKRIRADLNREFADFETVRKRVKAKVLKPYEDFERVYKECISDAYKSADGLLKGKIGDVENTLIAEKVEKLTAYYAEKCEEAEIDFIPFEKLGLKITLSAKEKDLKNQIDAYLLGVESELKVIASMENADEIRVEYAKCLDLAGAITSVQERKAAIAALKEAIAEEKAKEAVEEVEAVEPVEEATLDEEDGLPLPDGFSDPAEPASAEAIFEAPRKTWKIAVEVTEDEKRALMVFMAQNKIAWTEG